MQLQIALQTGPRKGTAWILGEVPLAIGRDPDCDIIVSDSSVSRRHCLIWQEDAYAVVRDLDSRNATLIGGRPVQQSPLVVGAEISIGRVRFMITAVGLVPSAPPTFESEPKTASILSPSAALDLASGIQGMPQNVGDLARLFRACRACGTATSLHALMAEIEFDARERFPNATVSLLLCRQSGQLEFVPTTSAEQSGGAADRLRRFAENALASAQPVHARLSGDGTLSVAASQLILAPLQLRGQKLGILAVEAGPGREGFNDSDLEYLTALSYGIAPFVHLQEDRKVLEAVATQLDSRRRRATEFIGSSEKLRAVLYLANIVAESLQPVMILGETGTGKEVLSRFMHARSPRADGPLIAVNCAAIPNDLFESEVFGHERGAFTGAVNRRLGLLEQSHTGTLFLDEIGELSVQNQARILRAIETGHFRRVGGQTELTADFRLLAATNRDLAAAVKEGKFREDLYHRLRGLEIRLPPLRERREDIPLLVDHFIKEIQPKLTKVVTGLTPDALNYLTKLDWPGNVRELRHCVQSACVLTRTDLIDLDILQMLGGASSNSGNELPWVLADMERVHIERALKHCDGKIAKAADLLGISRSALYYKVTQLKLQQ